MNRPLELWKMIVLLLGFAIGVFSLLESKEDADRRESDIIGRVYHLEREVKQLSGDF